MKIQVTWQLLVRTQVEGRKPIATATRIKKVIRRTLAAQGMTVETLSVYADRRP